MKKWILLSVLLLVVTGVAQAIPNPAAVYCILQGYEYEIRTDEQGNQYGVCVFPDGSECGAWDYYRKCELNGIGYWPGDFSCHWPCKEMRCKEAGESVLVSRCCEGLDEIYPAHIFDANCNELGLVGWLFLCSDCGNGICESWESKCNCPEDCAQPCIIYVDADANGANDGSSWTDAYNYLQDGLAVAWSGDEVRVAEGIYKPDQGVVITPGDRTATFQLINGVAIKGGYAGFGEPDANERDIDEYETVLSGDLLGNDGLDFANNGENSYHVVTSDWYLRTGVLDGLTITAGNANGPGGWPNYQASGGGMKNLAHPTIVNCTIIGNHADSRGGGSSSTDCGGGGKFIGCTIRDNTAGLHGGGVSAVFYDSPKFFNCVIINNKAGEHGGGIYSGYSRVEISNCTFSGNSAETGKGGGIYQVGNEVKIDNSILWGDTAATGGPEIAMIGQAQHTPTRVEVSYSDVQGGQGMVYQEGAYGTLVWGEGNIDADPCFADAANGDYHLKSQAGRWDANEGRWTKDEVTSPCIDAGDMASPIGSEPFPNGGIINMGAYGGTTEASKSYFGEPVCETIVAGDINGDCKVNFLDFRLMALHWLRDENQ